MYLIAAADKNWAIGKNGGLLYRLPQDMKFFRETTQGSVVVMGRKTLDSFPGGKPLKNRVNIVFTRNADFEREGVITCGSADELMKILDGYKDKNVFVIGGEQIYRLLLPYCTRAYITRVNAEAEADSYLPDLEKEGWHITSESDTLTDNGIDFKFVVFEK